MQNQKFVNEVSSLAQQAHADQRVFKNQQHIVYSSYQQQHMPLENLIDQNSLNRRQDLTFYNYYAPKDYTFNQLQNYNNGLLQNYNNPQISLNKSQGTLNIITSGNEYTMFKNRKILSDQQNIIQKNQTPQQQSKTSVNSAILYDERNLIYHQTPNYTEKGVHLFFNDNVHTENRIIDKNHSQTNKQREENRVDDRLIQLQVSSQSQLQQSQIKGSESSSTLNKSEQKVSENNSTTPIKAMVENVMQKIQPQSSKASNSTKKDGSLTQSLSQEKNSKQRKEQSVSCVSSQDIKASHNRNVFKDNKSSQMIAKFEIIKEQTSMNQVNTKEQATSQKSQLRSQTALSQIVDQEKSSQHQNYYKRSNTPNTGGTRKKQTQQQLSQNKNDAQKIIPISDNSSNNYGLVTAASKKQQQEEQKQVSSIQSKNSKTPKSSTQSKLFKNKSNSSANIIKTRVTTNQKTTKKQILEQQDQPQIVEKPKKTVNEQKQLIKERLGAIFIGYKIRRILKQNRILRALKIEFIDMQKFANSLKSELTDNIKTNSSQTAQTRQLLIQSIKDLSQKKDQFFQAFEEAVQNPQWMKLSKPQQPKEIKKQMNKANNSQSVSQLDSEKSQNSILTSKPLLKNPETKSYSQQLNNLLTAKSQPRNIVNEKEQTFGRNKNFKPQMKTDSNLKKQQQKRDHDLASSNAHTDPQPMNNMIKKYLTSNQFEKESQEYQTQINSSNKMFDNENSAEKTAKQVRKDFLRKGIQSRKYDPRTAIEQEKQRKKEKKYERSVNQGSKQPMSLVKEAPTPINVYQKSALRQDSDRNQRESFISDQVPMPQILRTEPTQLQSKSNISIGQRHSHQFASKIPRLQKKDSLQSNSISINNRVSHCQSTKHLSTTSSFLAPIFDDHIQESSPVKGSQQLFAPHTVARIPKLRKNSKTSSHNNQLSISQSNLHQTVNKSLSEAHNLHQTTPSQLRRRSSISREQRHSVTKQDIRTSTGTTLNSNGVGHNQRQRELNNSCSFNQSNQQVQKLIEELRKNAEINKEAKQKTIETLSAINGMLNSLRNNEVFREANKLNKSQTGEKSNANNQLKSKFDCLVKNLQSEFNMLLKEREKHI